MNALSLNSEFFTLMGQVADDEALMQKIVNYVKKLVKKKPDPTLMTKEEFFAKIEQAERELDEGKGIAMLPGESLSDFIKRVG